MEAIQCFPQHFRPLRIAKKTLIDAQWGLYGTAQLPALNIPRALAATPQQGALIVRFCLARDALQPCTKPEDVS